MKKYRKLKKCRLCQSTNLSTTMNLGKTPIGDHYFKKKYKIPFFPLKLLYCRDCTLSLIDCVVDKYYINKGHFYETHNSLIDDKYLSKFVDLVSTKINLKKNDLVVDIGSYDGALLDKFKKKNYKVLGTEVINSIAKIANKKQIKTINAFLNAKLVKKIISIYKKPKLIILSHYFANIDNVNEFSNHLFNLIHENGTIVIETPYIGSILKGKVFDWIFHEHLSYFNIHSLKSYFEKNNFKLYNIDIVDMKGGSFRYYFTNNKNNFPINRSVNKLLKNEKKIKINSVMTFKKFQSNIDIQKKKLHLLLKKFNSKKIAGYGASTTTTTLLFYFKIGNFFKYIVDDNSNKFGSYSPGYHIPILSRKILKTDPPDVIVILAWRHEKIIMKNLIALKKKYKIKKLSVIIPLPNLKLYNL